MATDFDTNPPKSEAEALQRGATPEQLMQVNPEIELGPEPIDIDVDIPVGDEFEIDLLAQQTTTSGSEEVDNRVALMTATLDEQSNEFIRSLQEEFVQTKDRINSGVPIQAIVDESLQRYGSAVTQDVMNGVGIDQVDQAVTYAAQVQQDIQSVGALEKKFVEAVSQSDSFREQNAIAGAYTSNVLTTYLKGKSEHEKFWDATGEVLSSLLLPTTRLAINDLTGEFLDGDVAIETLQSWWTTLDPEEQVLAAQGLIDEIDRKTGGDTTQTANLFDAITTGRDMSTELALELGLVAFDVTAGLFSVGKAIKTMRNVNSTRAGEANAVALTDTSGEAVKSLETPKEVAAINANSFNFEHLSDEFTDGVAADTINYIEAQRAEVGKAIYQVDADGAIADRTLFTEAERVDAQNRALDIFKDPDSKFSGDSAVIIDRSDTGFTVEYEYKNFKGQKHKRTFSYTAADVGDGVTFSATPIKSKVWSPETIVEPQMPGAVVQSTLVGFTEGRVLRELNKAMHASYKGVKKEGKQKLEDILYYGDEQGKEFSVAQLTQEGIPTINGRHVLNKEEAAAYYGTRMVMDELWRLKNRAIRQDLEFKGFSMVKARNNGKLSPTFVRPAQSLPNNASSVYHGTRREGVAIDSDLKAKIREGELEVVEFQSPITVGESRYTHAVINPKDKKGIPTYVLNKPKGYMPLIRKDAFYFVKKEREITVNGKSQMEWVTTRYFDNKVDADAFAAAEEAATGQRHKAHFDRDMTDAERDADTILHYGGMYGSPRTDREILQGLRGETGERVSAMEAIERNIRHISNVVPMNTLRLDMQARWLKGTKQWLREPNNFNSEFDFTKLEKGSKEHLGAEAVRDYIKDQLRIPTDSEIVYAKSMQRIAEWMEDKPLVGGAIRKSVLNLAQQDPFGALRAGAFHPLLGWFNPAQYFVQGQSAAVAISIAPEKFPLLWPQFWGLRAALPIRHNTEALKKLSKVVPGVTPDEFVEMVRDFDRTGLYQSLRSNADFDAAGQGYAIDGGAIKRAADAGLIFFREGELFGRAYSWLWARDDMLKQGLIKKGTKLTQQDIDAITTDAVKHMLNLNRANRAHWQKGAWSIPTQFQQINSKVLENFGPEILGLGGAKKFTPKQKAKVWTGQALLFGAAGIPLGSFVANGVMSMTGEDRGDIDPVSLAAYTDGATGMIQQAMFGEIVQGSDRLAFAQGINTWLNAALDGELPKADVFFGPAGAIAGRTSNAISNLVDVLNVSLEDEGEITTADVLNTMASFGDIFSTFSNAHKALIWEQLQYIPNSNGGVRMDLDVDGEDYALIWGKALGFQSKKEASQFDLLQYNKTRNRRIQDGVKALNAQAMRYVIKQDFSDQARSNHKAFTNILKQSYTPLEWEEVVKGYAKFNNENSDLNEWKIKALDGALAAGGYNREGSVDLSLNPHLRTFEE